MKPIQSATVFFNGDPSVGIQSCSFELEMWFDPSFASDVEAMEALDEIRESIEDTYELISGDERPHVMFDFEVIRQAAIEARGPDEDNN